MRHDMECVMIYNIGYAINRSCTLPKEPKLQAGLLFKILNCSEALDHVIISGSSGQEFDHVIIICIISTKYSGVQQFKS